MLVNLKNSNSDQIQKLRNNTVDAEFHFAVSEFFNNEHKSSINMSMKYPCISGPLCYTMHFYNRVSELWMFSAN